MDEIDIALVGALEEDARMPLVRLAQRAGISESTAGRRLARLRAAGELQLVTLHVPWRGGSTEAIIAVSVDPAQIVSVAETLGACEAIRYVAITTGEYDVVVEGLFSDNADLNRFLQEQVFSLPGVRGTTTFVVLTTKKIWGEPALVSARRRAQAVISRP
jgi:Lrp/AsnC family transcriptional regulator for asnA, asnC and gidA